LEEEEEEEETPSLIVSTEKGEILLRKISFLLCHPSSLFLNILKYAPLVILVTSLSGGAEK
jgi:hypothetical protein